MPLSDGLCAVIKLVKFAKTCHIRKDDQEDDMMRHTTSLITKLRGENVGWA